MHGMVIIDIDGQVAADDLVVLHTAYTGWCCEGARDHESSVVSVLVTADWLMRCMLTA
jgi:hypothetical protein